jgi:hypothetical protein
MFGIWHNSTWARRKRERRSDSERSFMTISRNIQTVMARYCWQYLTDNMDMYWYVYIMYICGVLSTVPQCATCFSPVESKYWRFHKIPQLNQPSAHQPITGAARVIGSTAVASDAAVAWWHSSCREALVILQGRPGHVETCRDMSGPGTLVPRLDDSDI